MPEQKDNVTNIKNVKPPLHFTNSQIEVFNELINQYPLKLLKNVDSFAVDELVRLVDKQRNQPHKFKPKESECLIILLNQLYMTPLAREELKEELT